MKLQRYVSLIQVLLATGLSAATTNKVQPDSPGAGICWMLAPPQPLVQAIRDLQPLPATASGWEGVITNTQDPFLVLAPVRMDADKEKVLYLELAVESGRRVQLFFSPDGEFQEQQSIRARGLAVGAAPAIYALDLSAVPAWHGQITALRLDFEDIRKGSRVKLLRVGVGKSGSVAGAIPLVADSGGGPCASNFRRNAAFQDTIVATDECHGSSALMTFIKNRFGYGELNVLARLLAQVEIEGRQLSLADAARDLKVEDFPGGVRARCQLGGSQIITEFMPLCLGRDTAAQDGAALFSIRAEPPLPLAVDCGDSMVENPFSGLFAHSQPSMANCTDQIALEAGAAFIKSKAHSLLVAVRGDTAPSIQTNLNGGQYLQFRAASGQLSLLLSYAEDAAQLRPLCEIDFAQARKQVQDYYATLLQARVQTPVKNLNEAFRTALYNLEYAWNAPFGWTESLNFWHALWHMQHTAGEEWIGHADRSRLCNLTHAEHLLPNGAVPQMMQYVHTRRDFGGSNQFFAWQVRHYFQFSGDLEFARRMAPVLDRVIAQTFGENDPDGNLLLAWGQQIGNQEDYISTPHDGTSPSIEGINMLRTRRELALALGDQAALARCDARIRQIQAALREQLWQPDLGRFAFFRDPLGQLRLDGQYHSLIYPVIWDLADALDGYSMLRHLRDRLTGKDGEVYCSDNFATHQLSTVGVQAGIAQQPWGAWALAAAGRRNEVVRPLQAAANWVMDEHHRGAWPEIASEPTPAYFSPPVGLLVAATVEALFGLKVNKPEGRLSVAPCFPDDWPAASLNLPEYQAEFTRSGNTMEYRVRSRDALARHVRWSLPPCRVLKVTLDGKSVPWRVEPGVECMFLRLETPPSRDSRFCVQIAPLKYEVRAPASIAEGEPLGVGVSGLQIEGIEDRSSVLAGATLADSHQLQARIRTGLLDAYRSYGRLGQLTFSRRIFFLRCKGQGDLKCWLPVDVAVLPRYEAAPAAELRLPGETLAAKLLLRNNTARPLAGSAWLRVAQGEFPSEVNLAPRSQGELTFHIPTANAAFLSAGDNAATLVLPEAAALNVTLEGSRLFKQQDALLRYQQARVKTIPLPAGSLVPDTDWRTLRSFKAYVHGPWNGSQPPLQALGSRTQATVPGLEGVRFRIEPSRLVPVSFATGRSIWSLSLSNLPCKKLYLLLVPFLDNHDVYAPVARVDVEASDGVVLTRTLHTPGDLDWWSPPAIVGDFATARQPRKDRFGLLPLLAPSQGDWTEGRPPAFPQAAFWASCRQWITTNAVFNVVEMDLGRLRTLKTLSISTLGTAPALGVVAVSAETGDGAELLNGTRFALPEKAGSGRVLFEFDKPNNALGWKLEGEAFSVSAEPRLFPSLSTLNSLAKAGETATGTAVSPEFTIRTNESWMLLEIQGGNAATLGGRQNLCLRLVDALTSAMLKEVLPPGSHTISEERISVAGLQGRRLRLEVLDRNSEPAYAWIGLRKVTLIGNDN